ncbi:MAG: right-handed parallel beta-helix repeat-containing protein [candidate division Zixibacteria bacterium]|nr:right-handed parallel beta-helix repeat-containing protein [candidate division Zixibacteria bacterium]
MRSSTLFLTILILLSPISIHSATYYVDDLDSQNGSGTVGDPFRNLQSAIKYCKSGDTLIIAEGHYNAARSTFTENLCGNCQEHKTKVNATTGFVIKNKALALLGADEEKTILITSAGYGLYIENSSPVYISGLTITGGIRNADGNATDAGIVVRNSRVTIANCLIKDNTDRDTSIVVGIGGIFGREGAELFITNNTIENNGWDGIALYRGAMAFITDNIIRKGRGAGIGITWDATATILRNRISEYWKGIGSFGDTRVVARNNEVFDNLGWGIIASGTSWMDASNNSVIRNGNCGMAVWGSDCSGRFTNNLIMDNGWRKEWVCPCVGVWIYAEDSLKDSESRLTNFEISYNNVWNNKAGNYQDIPNLTGKFNNISTDPNFANATDSTDFRVKSSSTMIDAGNPLITDNDGSVSDIGVGSGSKVGRK